MQYHPVVPIWKRSPFLRLLPPFIAGLLVQFYYPLPQFTGWLLLFSSAMAMVFFSLISLAHQFRLAWLNGAFLHFLLFATGVLLLNDNDIRRQTTGINLRDQPPHSLLVSVQAPLSEKDRTWKTVGQVQAIVQGETVRYTRGKILLYFQKHSQKPPFQYGNQLIIKKALQPVQATGNPGSFNYQRYCIFQGIMYQAFLKPGDFNVIKIKNENLFRKFLLSTQQQIVAILQRYIPGQREAGMAEAMLIGYKEDLDKNLLQSYSNTGVVHIIAISGLHLGLIYWLLMGLCKLPGKLQVSSRLRPWIVIAGLWLFSCLAGGSPSVLRSAVMFTCLVIGQHINRRSSIYNSLAGSAFVLLCYNPFWLWDAGFQLSYAAVLSLAVFMKPIYNLFYVKNKIADYLWKATAVTMAAQVLTLPLSVYHFHQFPNYFLVANLLAVPLSGVILFGEIVLCAVSFVPVLATATGQVVYYLIYWLNCFIEWVNQLPFASWQGLQIDLLQAVCLYIVIAGLWRLKKGIWWALPALLVFSLVRSWSFLTAGQQQKLVVYNVPRMQAIDLYLGRTCYYTGDSLVPQRFHVLPSRWLHRVAAVKEKKGSWLYNKVLVIDKKMPQVNAEADIIILSHNANVQMNDLARRFRWKHLVIDNSNSFSSINRWKQDCIRLGLPCHVVGDKGAFVLSLY
jgi:ComEC/Rec2-related protein